MRMFWIQLTLGVAALSPVWAPLAEAQSKSGKIEVDVELFPGGSFTAKSDQVIGKGVKSGSSFSANEVKVPVKSIKTGIDLRDEHLQKKLEADKHPHITVSKISASGGKGTAKIKIMDTVKEVHFTYKDEGDHTATAEFELNLKDFKKISGISYQGFGVEDVVKVRATIPYQTGAGPKAGGKPKETGKKK